MQSQVRLNRVSERRFQSGEGSGEGLGDFGAEPGQTQQDSREGSGEGLGEFGAEPGQVQQGFGRLWCRATSGSTGFRRRFRRRFQRRSGRLGCRATSGSTGVPEKVPEKVWEALVLNRVPEKVPEKVWESLVQSQVRLNRVSERRFQSGEGSGEGLGDFGAEPRQFQQGSGEGGPGGFGAEPRQVQQGFGVVQSQVRLNRVPEKVPEKVWEALVQSRARFNDCRKVQRGSGGSGWRGGEPGQVQRGSGEGSGEGSGRVLVWPGSTRLQVGSGAIPGVRSSKFRTKQ